MKTKGLDKVLRGHFQHCAMHQHSLMEKRYCSCGIEKARVEKEILAEGFEWITKAYEYFQSQGSISFHSLAGAELEDIIKKAQDVRIISPK